jgi:hypothetical protein
MHYHKNKIGVLVTCYKHCTDLLSDWRFWVGITVSYPLEHFLWEHVWPFKLVMGLI